MSTLMKQLEMRLGEKRAPTAPYKGPDKKSANGNRPLTFPTPYHGGKRRWAEEILHAFGPERDCVYVEPFSGSAAVLLANERPYAREILCDTNPHITNVFRSLAWAPEETAFWADWPTIHQDLTSRHTWLLRWAVDNVARIESDPDFYDAKAAGWWLWGKSNWIGSEFGIVRGYGATKSDAERQATAEYDADRLPGMRGLETADDAKRPWDLRPHVSDSQGQGVQTQRDMLPVAPPDKRPHVKSRGWSGDGVQPQRADAGLPVAPEKIPHVKEISAGNGVSAQRHGDFLYGGGKGYQPPVAPDQIPGVSSTSGQGGVNAQSAAPYEAKGPDKIPFVREDSYGRGVNAQRDNHTLPYSSNDIPKIGADAGGKGIQAQRQGMPVENPPDKRPFIAQGNGGNGVQTGRQPQDESAPLPSYDGRAYQPDKRPQVGRSPHGQGVSALRKDDTLPQVDGDFASLQPPDKRPIAHRPGGVSAQRHDDTLPSAPDKRPSIPGHGPVGIQSHSRDIDTITAPDGIPHVGKGVGGPTAQGVQTQWTTLAQQEVYAPAGPIPLTGDRLKPWFIALAQRLYRVIILNRGWQSGLTPTVLQQTRTARKPPVRVLLDPPYKGVGKLYGMSETEADALAIASWEWALENGSRETWRIAYSCREGDFDEVALAHGWTSSKMGISANHNDNTQEVIWFSPYCIR